MSWDKNTVVISQIDAILETLQDIGEAFSLTVLGEVRGIGLNDDSGKTYSIRRLAYKDAVVLEQMYRADDCDADDIIFSFKFNAISEPNDWPLEVLEDAEENDDLIAGTFLDKR